MGMINKLELASELAHKAMVKELLRTEVITTEEDVYSKETNNENYTFIAQEIFNEYYDEFYDIITAKEIN